MLMFLGEWQVPVLRQAVYDAKASGPKIMTLVEVFQTL